MYAKALAEGKGGQPAAMNEAGEVVKVWSL